MRFADVSAAAGLAGSFDNTIAAIAFDYDGDGWLDLLLGHYFPRQNLLALTTPHVLPNDLDDADNGGGLTLWHNVPLAGGGTAASRTSPPPPASAASPAGRSTSATATSTTTATRTSTSPATTAPTACS